MGRMAGFIQDTKLFWILSFVWASVVDDILAIDCFKCVSIGGNNPACEDPFHNNYTADILERPCWAGRKDRNGLFPATACIKLSGKYGDTGETMMVRGCGLDSGTLTIDTEIVRMSHCGSFYFDNRYVSGCLQCCTDDACNAVSTMTQSLLLLVSSQIFPFWKYF